MTELDAPEHSVAGMLAWYSTIHLPPEDLDGMFAETRRLLASSGMLVAGFFDSDDDVAVRSQGHHGLPLAGRRLCRAPGEGRFHRGAAPAAAVLERPDRKYAAIAARTS